MEEAADIRAYTGQKRCPHCGQWSGHYQRPDDRCVHCGQLLDPLAPAREASLEKAWKWELNKTVLIDISPDDPWLLRMLKHLVRGGQLLFAATVAFILWLITLAAA